MDVQAEYELKIRTSEQARTNAHLAVRTASCEAGTIRVNVKGLD